MNNHKLHCTLPPVNKAGVYRSRKGIGLACKHSRGTSCVQVLVGSAELLKAMKPFPNMGVKTYGVQTLQSIINRLFENYINTKA